MIMGVHAAMPVRSPTSTVNPILFPIQRRLILLQTVILWFILSTSCAIVVLGDDGSANDANALLKFKETLLSSTTSKDNAKMSQYFSSWIPNTNPCTGGYPTWEGVLCTNKDKIWGLRLENSSLSGDINIDPLLMLSREFRAFSIMNNSFEGPLPDFKNLGLVSLYLSYNQFSGQIPKDAFADMPNLKKLYLANNQFRGTIPGSFGQLSKLLDLSLENNHFTGSIPNFTQTSIKVFNVSNNELEGPIPPSLSFLDPSAFSGNKDLCGKPMNTTCKDPVVDSPPPPPQSAPVKSGEQKVHKGEFSMMTAILVVTSFGIVLGIIILVVMMVCHRRRKNQKPRLGNAGSSTYNDDNNKSNNVSMGRVATHQNNKEEDELVGDFHWSPRSSPLSSYHTVGTRGTHNASAGGGQQRKLTFIRDDHEKFDLQDLLRASAEVLGSGNFGSSYKAVLMDAKSVVVKRFKQMNSVDRQEFNEHMTRLGQLIHPNLLPLVAYYYRKEEKLLVSDYIANGSLASHLHGNRRQNQPGLDWPTRLKIVQGVAKGLSYLYKELTNIVVPNGHLKSSNVLLDESFNAILMDYALIPVMNPEHVRKIMVAYRSPEYIQTGRLSKKTDVWSLGILILEILTGKFPPPNHQLPTGKATGTTGDLVSWVDSIVKENEAVQVLDKYLVNSDNYSNCEGEMLKLFQIGMACCEEDVSKRLSIEEAFEKIQDLKKKDRTENIINNNNQNYNLSLI